MTKHLGRTCLVLTFVLALFFLLHDIYNYDIGMHIRAGEHILNSKSIPRQDIFSHTATSSPWVNHQWLAQLLLYLIYRLAGAPGLILLQAAVFLGAYFLLYLIARQKVGHLTFSAAMALAVLISDERFLVRPFIFSTLFACAYLYLLEDHRRFGGRKLFLIPALQIFWSNLHAGFHFGLLLTASYLVVALLESGPPGRFVIFRGERQRPRGYRNLALVLALSFAASFANPYGHKAFFEAFSQTGSAVFSRFIAEWRSPFIVPTVNAQIIFYYKLYIAAAAASFALNCRRLNIARLIVFLLTLYLSAKYRRFIAEFAMLNLPIMTFNFVEGVSHLMSFRPFESVAKRLRKFDAAAAAALLGFILLLIPQVATNAYYIRNDANQRFGIGLSDINYPVKEVNFVISRSMKGNMFNSEELGGYIIWRAWPDRKVFIDGRNLVYGDKFFSSFLDTLRRPGAWEDFFSRFSVDYAVVSLRAGNELLIKQLYDDKRWRLLYIGDVAAVYSRSEGKDKAARYRPDFRGQGEGEQKGFFKRKTFPIGHLKRGDFYLMVDLMDEAALEYRAALARTPRHPWPHAGLGTTYLKSENIDKAMSELMAALYLKPSMAEALHNLGVTFNRKKLSPRAIENFKRAIAARPDYAEAYSNLGNIYLNSERYAEAIDSYLKAIARYPYNIGPYLNAGAAYAKLNLFENAITMYKRAIEIDPQGMDARLNLGAAHLLLGRYAEAIDAYKSALALAPQKADVYKQIADAFLRWGKPGEAIQNYERALEIDQGDPEALRGIAASFNRSGKFEKATEYYLKALGADPQNHLFHFELGSLFAARDLKQKAVFAFKKSVHLNPLQAEAHNNIGSVYQDLDMIDRAIKEHRAAVKLKPSFAVAHYNLGTAYGKKGMLADAIAELEKALELDPNFAKAHSNLGAAYFLAKNYNMAFQHLARAEELGLVVNKELMRQVKRLLTAP